MASALKMTVTEAIRYRGKWGHYSWLAHRISGLSVLLYLTIHVWDTANATFWPEAYSYTVELFKWLPFSIGEIMLLAAVLYHAFNGIRITLLDFKPEWWRYERGSAIAVWALFAVTFVPLGILMLNKTIVHCSELAEVGGSCLALPLP